jgi:nucleotide-binding universal stress UspA family protein
MASSKRILVAVDLSEASRRTVAYVADLAGGKPEIHVGLLHLELPPKMLEWGGSENPDIEDKISEERADAYQDLEKQAIQDGQSLLQRLQAILVERKINVVARLVQFEEPLDPKTVTKHILQIAKEREYGTVVVGRHSFSGLLRQFRHHVGEELVRTAKGLTVWVVE